MINILIFHLINFFQWFRILRGFFVPFESFIKVAEMQVRQGKLGMTAHRQKSKCKEKCLVYNVNEKDTTFQLVIYSKFEENEICIVCIILLYFGIKNQVLFKNSSEELDKESCTSKQTEWRFCEKLTVQDPFKDHGFNNGRKYSD